jgi:hypothetical protein
MSTKEIPSQNIEQDLAEEFSGEIESLVKPKYYSVLLGIAIVFVSVVFISLIMLAAHAFVNDMTSRLSQ